MTDPSPNGFNGRTSSGHFAHGNRLGRGNPFAGQVARLRAALLAAVTADDLTAIVAKLIESAKAGDLAAARLVLDRCVGKFVDHVPTPRRPEPEQNADVATLTLAEKQRLIAQAIARLARISDHEIDGAA